MRYLTFAVLILGLATGCSQAEQITGKALSNANSVIRSGEPKIWKTPANSNVEAQDEQKQTEKKQ